VQLMLELENGHWQRTKKSDTTCVALADRHYSRVTIGAKQFTRPGENIVFRTADGSALWVSWRSQFNRKDGFGKAWECQIFRNESDITSSLLIKEAIEKTIEIWGPLPSDGMITYVSPTKVKSQNPGYSFLRAGFQRLKHRSSRGLLTYRITQDRFEGALESDLAADEIVRYLDLLEDAFQSEDPEWYSLADEISNQLIHFIKRIKSLKKAKNCGYQDIVFRLNHFFQMLGELDSELEEYYWNFNWD
jgi:hypothetical protein